MKKCLQKKIKSNILLKGITLKAILSLSKDFLSTCFTSVFVYMGPNLVQWNILYTCISILSYSQIMNIDIVTVRQVCDRLVNCVW